MKSMKSTLSLLSIALALEGMGVGLTTPQTRRRDVVTDLTPDDAHKLKHFGDNRPKLKFRVQGVEIMARSKKEARQKFGIMQKSKV